MKRALKRKKAPLDHKTLPPSPSPSAIQDTAAAVAQPAKFFLRPDRPILPAGILFLSVVLTFLPSLKNGFVDYDDPTYVTYNSHVKDGLTIAGLKWAITSIETSNWHPLTWISHALDCQFYGLHPWGHHLTSVLLHAANAVLLFLVLRRMTGATWRSLFVAAVFGLHPLRVESVTWISERKDVLSTLFWLLALWTYVRYTEETRDARGKSSLFYGLSLLFLALGLMSKPMLVTFPFLLLLLDHWPLGRVASLKPKRSPPPGQLPLNRLLWEKLPFIVLAAAACVITLVAQRSVGAVATTAQFSLSTRFENALVSYCRYLGKLFWPADLCVIYLPPPANWSIAAVLLSTLLLAGVSLLAVVWWRRRPWLATGWFWFLGTLIPTIGLVQVGSQAMADRYSYVPTVGIILIATWWVCELTRQWRVQTAGLTAAAVILAGVCAAITLRQIGYWKDNEALYRRVTSVTQDNFLAHNSLGVALYQKKQYDEAIAEYRASLKINPRYYDAQHNLIASYISRGRLDEAISQFAEAKSEHLDYPAFRYSLGLALRDRNLLDEAIVQFGEVPESSPEFAAAQASLGDALLKSGRVDDAMSHLQTALRLHPEDAQAHINLGLTSAMKGRMDDAITQFQEALRLQPDSAESHNWLGSALVEKGRVDEGISQLEQALKLKPDFADAHNNLGTAFLRKEQFDEAIQQYEEALKLKPDNTNARGNLKVALDKKNARLKP